MREARAYAKSIYLMAGMPYLLLTAFGIYAVRAVKTVQKKADGAAPESDDIIA
jgi:hypothetical protein